MIKPKFSERVKRDDKRVRRRVVLAWDPDFTKLTPKEAQDLKQSEAERERGEILSIEEIDWN